MFTHSHDIPEDLIKTIREQHDMVCEYKVGDIVIPNTGAHAGIKHKVVKLNEKSRVTIAPMGLMGGENKYRYGVAVATRDQIDRPEDLKEGVDQRAHGITKVNGTSKKFHAHNDDENEWGAAEKNKKKSWSDIRHQVRRVKAAMTEEVEQIEELSTDTLKSYKKKATKDSNNMLDKDRKMKDSSEKSERKFINRNNGISRATDKLDEGFNNWTIEFERGDRAKVIHGDHKGKRGTVIAKHEDGAVYEIKHEDGTTMKHHVSTLSEGLVAELSKATLGRYVKKASNDSVEHMARAGRMNASAAVAKDRGDKEGESIYRSIGKKSASKAMGRQAGISKAVDKLTTEETDDEARKELDRKIKKAGKEWEKKHGMKQGKGSVMDPPAPKKKS